MSKEQNSCIDAEKVAIYILGREYRVPPGLTIMKAMEYAGYNFVRSCGCRGGFCGACATIYKVKGNYKLNVALACQETIQDGMYITQIPFTPAEKVVYDLERITPSASVFMEYYPEVAKCVSCNTCTKACPQDLEVMDYVQSALRGNFGETATLSFDCISCGLCAIRCPAEIVPYNVALLARRLFGKYVMPKATNVEKRIKEIKSGKFNQEIQKLIKKPVDDLKELYEKREIETE